MSETFAVPDGYLVVNENQRGYSRGLSVPADYDIAASPQTLLLERLIGGDDRAIYMENILPGGSYLFGSGAVGAPSISFYASQDTGIYLSADDDMVLVTGGGKALECTNTFVEVATGRALRVADLTSGSVLFINSAHDVAQDNDNLYWDATNKRLFVGPDETTVKSGRINIFGSGTTETCYTARNTQYDVEAMFGVYKDATYTAGYIGTATNHEFHVYGNSTRRLRMLANGSVLTYPDDSTYWQFNASAKNSDVYHLSQTSGYNFFSDADAKRFGIGTGMPQKTLDVSSSTTPQVRITNTYLSKYVDLAVSNTSELTLSSPSGTTFALTSAGAGTFTASVTGTKLYLKDATSQIVLDSDGMYTGTITMATLTASRTWTLPDASGTLVFGSGSSNRLAYWSDGTTLAANAALASTHVLYADGNGLPTGDANLTWASNNLQVTGTARITRLGLGIDADSAIVSSIKAPDKATVSTTNNLTADGTFNTDTGWTYTGWTISGGVCTHNTGNTNELSGTTNVTSGDLYVITFTVAGRTAGSFTVALNSVSTGTTVSTNATHTHYARAATANAALKFTPTSDFNGNLDNITIKRVVPSTAVQSIIPSDGTSSPMHLRIGPSGKYSFGAGESCLESLLSGEGNFAVGYQAQRSLTTGVYNNAIGYQVQNSLTTGNRNSAMGYLAQYSLTTGNYNDAHGYRCQYSLTTGSNNSAFGHRAQDALTTGTNNSAFGYQAQLSITYGASNSAFGTSAQTGLTDGSFNCAFGASAQQTINSGKYNNAVGYAAQYNLTSGQYNDSLGLRSGFNITTGNYNLTLGYEAGKGITTGSYNTIIGANVTGLASDLQYTIIIADGGGRQQIKADRTNGFIWNDDGNDHDFRLEGDTLSYMLFLDASAATENIALLTTAAPNWQSMDGGIYLGNCTTAPTGNPTGGGFLYAEAGALKWRGTSGTITTIAPAAPHCPKCGSDFMHEWESEKYGYLAVCMACLAEEIGERPWILKRRPAHAG